MSIRNEFNVHMLNDKGRAEAEQLAKAYSALLDVIDQLVPQSREKSVAITELQTSCFWAKRGIAVQKDNQLDVAPPCVPFDP